MSGCDFCNRNILLKNIHCHKEPLELSMISDDEGYAVYVRFRNRVKAMFEINYCPICGQKLEVESEAKQ